MENENKNRENKNLDSLDNEKIDGKNVMGGGTNTGNVDYFNTIPNIDPNLVAPGPDELGYDTTVIPLEMPIGGNPPNTSEAPPLVNNGFTATPGYQNGNS